MRTSALWKLLEDFGAEMAQQKRGPPKPVLNAPARLPATYKGPGIHQRTGWSSGWSSGSSSDSTHELLEDLVSRGLPKPSMQNVGGPVYHHGGKPPACSAVLETISARTEYHRLLFSWRGICRHM